MDGGAMSARSAWSCGLSAKLKSPRRTMPNHRAAMFEPRRG